MKIAFAQMNSQIGAFDANIKHMLEFQDIAAKKGADLLVFPFNCLSGFPLDGLVQDIHFVQDCQEALRCYASQSTIQSIVVVPDIIEIDSVKQVTPILSVIDNTNGINIDSHPFPQNAACFLIDLKAYKFLITLNMQLSGKEDIKKADIAIEICSMPAFAKVHALPALNDIGRGKFISNENDCYFCHVNSVGCNSGVFYAGGSFACNPDGSLICASAIDEQDCFVVNLNRTQIDSSEISDYVMSENEFIYRQLVYSVKDFVHKSGFSDVVLGLSGGLDSALVATIATDAFGPEHVHTIFLPGPYTSKESLDDSVELCKNLSISMEVYSINNIVDTFDKDFGDSSSLTRENVQARCRMLYIMAVSNENNWFVLNTSNKSEAAMGFSTLYGDTIGSFSPLGSIYKTTVFDIAKYRSEKSISIPKNIISKPPSSELYENALDSHRLPDYPILDEILVMHIEQGLGYKNIVEKGFDKDLVKSVLQQVRKSEFKRRQEPLSAQIGGISLNEQRNWPITNVWDETIGAK